MARLQRVNGKNGHWYTLDGQKVEGVTTLIANGTRKRGIESWSASATAGYAVAHWDELAGLSASQRLHVLMKCRFEDRSEAAKRGSEVHHLAEALACGKEIQASGKLSGYVNSAVAFLTDWQVKPIVTEAVIGHAAGRYAGTLDMVFSSPFFPQRVFLADWKTNRTGVHGETALQLAAYRYAEFYQLKGKEYPMDSLGITDTVAIWITPSGYEVSPMKANQETFNTFTFVAEVARRTGDTRKMTAELKGEPMQLPEGVANRRNDHG